MKKLLFFSLLAALALPVWAQGTAKPGVITVGFIPAEDSRAMVRQSQAILDIVAKHTGMKVDTFVGSDYNATIEALRAGRGRCAARAVLVRARHDRRAGGSVRRDGDRAHHAAELPVDHHRAQGRPC